MRAKHWGPARNDLEGMLFDGAPALLSQLDELVLRPRRWWHETLLPIIYLVCEPTARNPLDSLADRLHQARGVLHSRINGQETPVADNGQPPANSLRRLLDGVVADLSQRSGRGRPLRFPHYSLAVWLASLIMNHTKQPQPDQSGQRVDNALQDFIKERFRLQNRTTRAEVSVIEEIPWWVRIPVLLLPPLGIRLMRIFWRPPHWAARSRVASAHSAGSFRGLARKFMEQGSGEHQHDIQQDEIDRLLVDAFMEDLRCGYRRTAPFSFGRRRTTYPVLLIDKIGSTAAGLRLLKLISDSRTDYLRENTAGPGERPRKRAYFHPLLIIAQGDSSALDRIRPSNYRPEDRDGYSMADIKFYYREWHRALADSDRTWFILFKIPIERPPAGLRAKLTDIPLPAARKPVMMPVAAGLLIVAGCLILYDREYTHCGAWYWEPQLQRQALPNTDRYQCVGLGSSDHRFFADVEEVNGVDSKLSDELKDVEDRIHRTNEEAIKDPRYLTVVYLSELTPWDVGIYRSELEQLRGIAVAQQQGNLAGRPVRVLLANGGAEMEHGEAAAEAIAREASEDDALVAVLGLGSSREGTRKAIVRLARSDTHIPMIGTVISATDLATRTSSYYHQVAPTNQREAEVGAFYAATQLRAQNATIYYSNDEEDLFSKDLADKAKDAFEVRGVAVRERPYQFDDSDDINSAGRDACDVGPEGVAFYAGRASQLFAFLNGMQGKCQANYPRFLGGDSVSRFVLDGGLNNFPGLIVDYLALASSLAWGSECSGVPDSIGFFVVYQELFDEGACASTRRGGSLLAHDTLLVFIQGVRNTGVDRPSPDAVLRGIEDISSQGRGPLLGASGQIDYPRTGSKAIPQDKAILVLRGQAAMEPQLMILCGELGTAKPPQECPKSLGP